MALQQDLEFLTRHNVMDYSLLLGIGQEVAQQVDPVAAAPGTLSSSESGIQNAWTSYRGGIEGPGRHVYYMGIVDILQTRCAHVLVYAEPTLHSHVYVFFDNLVCKEREREGHVCIRAHFIT
eukprot:56183-Eustigmatos_ZCMA.PRE.1